MKEKTLFNFISERLNTNLRFYHRNRNFIEMIGSINDKDLMTESILNKIFENISINIPSIIGINKKYLYASIFTEKKTIIIGPVISSQLIKLSNDLSFDTNDLDIELQEVSILAFFDCIILINNSFNDDITFEQLIENNFLDKKLSQTINKRINDIRFEYNETNKSHSPYYREQRLKNAIKSGDLRLIVEASMENIRGEHGIVSEDDLQNNRSLAIVGITIASRAAIEAGIENEVILSLTDSFIQEINKANKEQDIETLVFNCNTELTKLVNEHNNIYKTKNINSPSYYSDKAKNYISNHLHQKIKITDIADSLNITPNYLSNLFKKNEGMTINEYVLNEKISLSKNMILYSEMSLLEIALLLGFSSQSHFCKVFKKVTNITPLEFQRSLT